MNLKQLFADEDAVSPVIGVILMVAITVILAAVIGTFVLGLGENVQDSAPQANFQFEYDDFADPTGGGSMDVTHTGGEDVEKSTLKILVGGSEVSSLDNWPSTVDTGSTEVVTNNTSAANGLGNAGDVVAGDSVRVVWTSPSGGTSNTIGQSTVPS